MDQLQATPRGAISGLLADAMFGGLNYMKDPRRTQQMQGLAAMLESTGVPAVVDRISYGEPLTTGAGMTTKLRPEAENTLMAALGMTPVGKPAIMATKGLPVGMSIKDVSPKIGINVNQGGSSFADKIISGEKKFETRESDSLRSYVGKRVGIIRTGEGKAKAIGDVTLGEPIVVSSAEEFAKLRDLHLVPEGSKFDIKEGGVKYLYPIENPVPYGVEKHVAKYGIVSRKILGEPDTLEKALYPQQAALDLAQERAALPVEQGGLGLPKDNTPMDRAKAMGFNIPAYHTSRTGVDTDVLDSGKYAIAPFDSIGTHFGTKEAALDRFNRTTGTTEQIKGSSYPVLLKGDKPYLTQQGEIYREDPLAMMLSEKSDYGNLPKSNANLRAEIFENNSIIPYINDVEATGSISYIAPPESIRSRFAAFDPFRRNAAIAAAMGVAAPNLLAAEPEKKKEEQQSNSLLRMLGF